MTTHQASGLAFHETGTGPTLLFLHAFPLDASQWDFQVAALSERYHCICPDFWGCGSSSTPPPQSTLGVFVSEILRYLDERQLHTFGVVGLSMGGYVAFEIFRQAPERTIQLVLADTRATADSLQARTSRCQMIDRVREHGVETIVEETTQRLIAPQNLGRRELVEGVQARMRRCTVEGIVACQQGMADRPDNSELLPTITAPTLIMVGENDTVTSPEESRTMMAAIRGARLEIIKGAGHLSNLEQPELFNDILMNWLTE